VTAAEPSETTLLLVDDDDEPFRTAMSAAPAPRGFAVTTAADAAAAEEATAKQVFENENLRRVLADAGGDVSEAARRLGMHRRSLERKLTRFPPRRQAARAPRRRSTGPEALDVFTRLVLRCLCGGDDGKAHMVRQDEYLTRDRGALAPARLRLPGALVLRCAAALASCP
jgi:CheY-like chemotaxis protein